MISCAGRLRWAVGCWHRSSWVPASPSLGEGAAVPILMLPIMIALILIVSGYMERQAAE